MSLSNDNTLLLSLGFKSYKQDFSRDDESIFSFVSASYEVSPVKEKEHKKMLKRNDEECKYNSAKENYCIEVYMTWIMQKNVFVLNLRKCWIYTESGPRGALAPKKLSVCSFVSLYLFFFFGEFCTY